MAQAPGTPRTIGRKVTEFLAANEQLRALKTDLRHLLFEDEVPLQSAARRQTSESDEEGGEASSGSRGPGQVRFDPNHKKLDCPANPEKGILKNATPNLVAQADSKETEDTNGGNNETIVVSEEESESEGEPEPEVSELEEELRQILLKGQGNILKWWEVIQQAHQLLKTACQKKIKGTEKFIFMCPGSECGIQFKKWNEIFDHYLQSHFDVHEGVAVKPMQCPATKCTKSYSTLMGFFGHIVKDHPGSRMHGVLVTVYQDHEVIPRE